MPRLRILWRLAFAIGAAMFLAELLWARANDHLDYIWVVIAFAVATIGYSAAFYLLCSAFAPEAADFIEDEGVELEGDNVVRRSTVAVTGDERIDFYASAFAAARGTTLVAVSTVAFVAIVVSVFGW